MSLKLLKTVDFLNKAILIDYFQEHTTVHHVNIVLTNHQEKCTFKALKPGVTWFLSWRIIMLIINAILLGIGLAMDAFSVSLANGLNEPHMKVKKMSKTSFVFGFFQCFMPLIGWLCVHTIVHYFKQFETFIPWIALILLGYIGGKMLIEGIRGGEEEETAVLTKSTLLLQGIATSIDALSVGFTIANYNMVNAFITAFIIGIVTFAISFAGLHIGKKFGTKLSGRASILGGIILIAIGLEIFISAI